VNLSANQMRFIGKICLVIGTILLLACIYNFMILKDDFFLPGDFVFYLPFIVVDFVLGIALLKMANETDDDGGGSSGGGRSGGFRIGKPRARY
jgi:uncharacterized membrane protein YgcG